MKSMTTTSIPTVTIHAYSAQHPQLRIANNALKWKLELAPLSPSAHYVRALYRTVRRAGLDPTDARQAVVLAAIAFSGYSLVPA